ncbi:hypothetical protein [Paenibacillus sp. y28]|uniref:hypothetical protein n=1 Tax=Paenibacillus sp. y28 TaxID=3129110 RepID=UPI00301AE8A6
MLQLIDFIFNNLGMVIVIAGVLFSIVSSIKKKTAGTGGGKGGMPPFGGPGGAPMQGRPAAGSKPQTRQQQEQVSPPAEVQRPPVLESERPMMKEVQRLSEPESERPVPAVSAVYAAPEEPRELERRSKPLSASNRPLGAKLPENEIVRGMIWAEVLGPPKARRGRTPR